MVAIHRWGTTAGKALLELEVVSVTTSQRPTWGQSARRQLLFASVPFAFIVADYAVEHIPLPLPNDLFDLLTAVAIVVMGFMLVHASLRVPGKRTPWDRVSGTMVRYRTGRGSTGAVA
jgi:hypothetical protein